MESGDITNKLHTLEIICGMKFWQVSFSLGLKLVDLQMWTFGLTADSLLGLVITLRNERHLLEVQGWDSTVCLFNL